MNEAQLDKQPPKVPEKIELPTDEESQRKLAAKLEEYEGREKIHAGHYHAPDSPPARMGNREKMKEILLEKVLSESSITYDAFETMILEQYSDLSAITEDIQEVFAIIYDYCTTGDSELVGGTGLPEITKA